MIARAKFKAAEPSPSYFKGNCAGDLPDVNVWLALAYDQHPHHAATVGYWHTQQSQVASLWFCRVTMLGLTRLLCQPAVMQSDVQTLEQSWKLYQGFMAKPFVSMLTEPNNVDQALGTFIDSELSAKHMTDAYLAALAKSSSLRLVSFDRGFNRFCGDSGYLLF